MTRSLDDIYTYERQALDLIDQKYDKTDLKQPCTEKDCMICQNSTKLSRKCKIPSIVYKLPVKSAKKQV